MKQWDIDYCPRIDALHSSIIFNRVSWDLRIKSAGPMFLEEGLLQDDRGKKNNFYMMRNNFFSQFFGGFYTYFIIQYFSQLSSRAGPNLAEW